MPTSIERLRDATMVPQDAPFSREIYLQFGEVLFDEARYPEAVEVFRLVQARWPRDPGGAEVEGRIREALRRSGGSTPQP